MCNKAVLVNLFLLCLWTCKHSSSLSIGCSLKFNRSLIQKDVNLRPGSDLESGALGPSIVYRRNIKYVCDTTPSVLSNVSKGVRRPRKLNRKSKGFSTSGGAGTLGFQQFTHLCRPGKSREEYAEFGVYFGRREDGRLYFLPELPRNLVHRGLLSRGFGLKEPDFSLIHEPEEDHRMRRSIEDEEDEEFLGLEPEVSSVRVEQEGPKEVDLEAKRLWDKYGHMFKPLETLEEKSERISKLPVTKINVEGVEVEVRMGTLGLPWYIDRENKKKLEATFDPDVLQHIKRNDAEKYKHYPLIEEEMESDWVPLPGIGATYFPNVKVLDHKTNIPNYDFVTLLHDSARNYTWTYQHSSDDRARSFTGEGELDKYRIEDGKIEPVEDHPGKYEPYVPMEYFGIQKDPREFYPRKPLDVGIFRLPKLEDVLNKKFKYIESPDTMEGRLGYHRDDQSFWKTEEYRDNGDKPGLIYRQLGKTGLKVSQVGLGTMMFGSTLSESQAHNLLDYAYDEFGVNFFDTCELYPVPFSYKRYGEAERILGAWIKKRGPGVRDSLVVSSRIACRNDILTLLRNSRQTGLTKGNIIEAVNSSLERLGLDRIDLLQFSWPDRYVPMQETGDYSEVFFDLESMKERQPVSIAEQLEAISVLLKGGKIRAWGLSNETPWGVLEFYRLAKEMGIDPPSVVQLNYNLLCRNEVEKGFVELARPQNTGIGIVAYGPLAGGILTGKYLEYADSTTAARLLRFPSYMKRYRGSIAAKAVKEYYEVSREFEHPNLTAMALKWVYSRPFIFSTIIGANDLYQLRENLHCLDSRIPVTDLMERRINQIHWKWRDPLRIVQ